MLSKTQCLESYDPVGSDKIRGWSYNGPMHLEYAYQLGNLLDYKKDACYSIERLEASHVLECTTLSSQK